jgi:hypothetical protein
MGFPRVFISSTCYDLGEVRDSLVDFLQGLHFEPILSDKGDIFYHPDLHTHESCITEVENSQLFLLIIGGRFGGDYKIDATKSVTNAEYLAARNLNRPVFTFVKRDVYDDHRLYQRNKLKKTVMKDIEFPSIEHQQYAAKIFEFINEVRLSDTNNGFFPFDYARDIRSLLGKQISGMIYDFLNKRQKEKEQLKINQVLDNLTLVNKKTEEILENIYKRVSKQDATRIIQEIDQELEASRFFKDVFRLYAINGFTKKTTTEIAKIDLTNLNWADFLLKTGDWYIKRGMVFPSKKKEIDVLYHNSGIGVGINGDLSQGLQKEIVDIEKLYIIFKSLSTEQRLKVLKNIEVS